MKVTAYCHGWVGAGVAAALIADTDIEPTLVLYPAWKYTDRHPCYALEILADTWTHLDRHVKLYRWPEHPSIEDCDAVVTANWRHVLTPLRYTPARLGGFNVHNSLLPMYKGRRPIQRARKDGQEIIGYSIHRLSSEIDSGDTLFRRHLFIGKEDEDQIYKTFGLLAGHDLLRIIKEQHERPHETPRGFVGQGCR